MKALLIIAQEGFQDHEYNPVKEILEKEKIEVETAAPELKECKGKFDGKIMPDVKLSDVLIINYDAIVIIGGPGAPGLGNLPEFNNLLKTAYDDEKIIAAICCAPMLLAKAGILTGKKATVFPDSEAVKAFKDFKVHYLHQDVVVDRNIITGNGQSAAKKFGEMIVELLVK